MNQKYKTAEASLRLDEGDAHAPRASRITTLMELAAARLVQQELHGARASIGIELNITHASPALASGDIRGRIVRAVARYRGLPAGAANRMHHVAIDAFDESGLIASAEHTRAIVDDRRAKAVARRRARPRPVLLEA
jgi:predicted thioesterase